MMPIKIRTAKRADASALITMHALSLRRLARGFYDPEVLEAFITQGPMDLTLLDGDGYFVAESNGVLLGSGGWSPDARSTIMPAPTVMLVSRSMTTNAPVPRLRR